MVQAAADGSGAVVDVDTGGGLRGSSPERNDTRIFVEVNFFVVVVEGEIPDAAQGQYHTVVIVRREDAMLVFRSIDTYTVVI